MTQENPLKSWSFLKFWKSDAWPDVHNLLTVKLEFHDNVLPRYNDWFKALELTPFDKVKVVILGQDPYPTRGHAHGLAFSVQAHVKPLPRSLRNIFTEYSSDLGYPTPRCGDLSSWAKEGVLLLNTILTVEEGKPLSHAGIGWEKLTYEIVRALSERVLPGSGPVFCLWGKRAQEYQGALRGAQVVCSAHPSPLSAANGFFGSKPFSKVNALLKEPIDWRLP